MAMCHNIAMAENIAVFCCGGTIDKLYFDAKSDYRVGPPAAIDAFRRARVEIFPPVSLMKKDSLDMDDGDRAVVVAALRDCPQSRILITHGSDTMPETARAVETAGLDKTVVLVGAWLPAAFIKSDSNFNIGFGLAVAMTLSAGVYVAMNGKILPAETVKKKPQSRML